MHHQDNIASKLDTISQAARQSHGISQAHIAVETNIDF